MNIIQKQADDFIYYKMRELKSYKDFVYDVKNELNEYNKDVYKIVFIERIIQKAKMAYDEHLLVCTNKDNCSINKFYENTLFFLQEELEKLEKNLPPEDFSKIERDSINETLQKILEELNTIKLGQEITYDDLSYEFEELKDLYYLDKKNWLQLFQGKIISIIANGIINETVSKNIVNLLYKNYDMLVGK